MLFIHVCHCFFLIIRLNFIMVRSSLIKCVTKSKKEKNDDTVIK